MKCPILIAAAITHAEKIEDSAVRCGKEECAWWDKVSCCCQIAYLKDIASALVYRKEVA